MDTAHSTIIIIIIQRHIPVRVSPLPTSPKAARYPSISCQIFAREGNEGRQVTRRPGEVAITIGAALRRETRSRRPGVPPPPSAPPRSPLAARRSEACSVPACEVAVVGSNNTYVCFSQIPRYSKTDARLRPRPLFSALALPRPACFVRSLALPSSFTYGFEHMNDICPRTRRLRASPCFPSLPFAPCFSPPAPRPDIQLDHDSNYKFVLFRGAGRDTERRRVNVRPPRATVAGAAHTGRVGVTVLVSRLPVSRRP